MKRPTCFKVVYLGVLTFTFTFCQKNHELPEGARLTPMKEYTVDNAREWTPIAKEHVPTAKRSINKGKPALIIEVPLRSADISHYIEKIGILGADGKEIAVEALPRSATPTLHAYFDLKLLPWSGKIKIFAKCNKHDLWVSEIKVKDLGL
ncbi:MAG TPA: hypothetical protein PLY93_10475 [Turneriella sp.]|nr:hypothetical protein [Turneriella sp.]